MFQIVALLCIPIKIFQLVSAKKYSYHQNVRTWVVLS